MATTAVAIRSTADFICMPAPMGRADDRGFATTRMQPASRVTLNWQAVPFTCRGKEETKWKREKNGRRVLRTLTGGGKLKYWRAPRPRPRMHRRSKRRCKKKVIHTALAQEEIVPMHLAEAQVTIQVLQGALRAALQRETALKEKLQETKKMKQDCAATIPAPRGEFDVERFRLIPDDQQTEWQKGCINEDDIAAAAYESQVVAYLEQKKRSDAADFAYIRAQDRAAFWYAVLEMAFTPHGIGILFILMVMMKSWFAP